MHCSREIEEKAWGYALQMYDEWCECRAKYIAHYRARVHNRRNYTAWRILMTERTVIPHMERQVSPVLLFVPPPLKP